MNEKSWKVWLFSSICFLFIGIVNLREKNYFLGSSFLILGVTYVYLSINYYKKYNKSNPK